MDKTANSSAGRRSARTQSKETSTYISATAAHFPALDWNCSAAGRKEELRAALMRRVGFFPIGEASWIAVHQP
jgi:hypothetical protein